MKNSDILKDYIFINKVIKLANPPYKQAGITSDITSWVVKYIDDQIDKKNTTTVVASIVPMVLSIALGCLAGPFGVILPMLTRCICFRY